MIETIQQMATVMAVAMADEDNKLHDRIKDLEIELKIDAEYIVTLQGMVDDYYVRCSDQEIEIEFLKRPLWVKIVGWFAR